MSSATQHAAVPAGPARPHSPFAALLSYLVPGLGQISQGRIGKGLLFFVCLYSMLFYGMYRGAWSNVYLPDSAARNNAWGFPRIAVNLYTRLQFAGQFWIGVAAWPAIWQYNHPKPWQLPEDDVAGRPVGEEPRKPPGEGQFSWQNFQKEPPERVLNELQTEGDKSWDLAWVYTVIAGVLNILVIYDAYAGPVFAVAPASRPKAMETVPP